MSDKYPGGFVTAGAPAGFSVAFNGSSYLSLATNQTPLLLGNSDFTFEGWVYWTATAARACMFSGQSDQASAAGSSYFFAVGTSGTIDVYIGSTNYGLNVINPTLNTWAHVAYVRTGGTLSSYLNGTRISTRSDLSTGSINNGSTTYPPQIGADGNAKILTGYMSSLRLIKGSGGYDATQSTITVPNQLFLTANTSLLTCQSPTIIDISTNAFAFTPTGSPTVSNFTPFAGYTGFNPALGAAAGGVWTLDEAAYYQQNRIWPIYDPYFNQTTLMLHGNQPSGVTDVNNNVFKDSSANNFTITRNGNTTQGTFTPFSQTGWSYNGTAGAYCQLNNADYSIGTGDFTIEFWMYCVDDTSYGSSAFAGLPGGGTLTVSMSGGSSNARQPYLEFGGTSVPFGTLSGYLNRWTHIAYVRTSGFVVVYQNGVATAAPISKSQSFPNSANLYLARLPTDTGQDFRGYLSNYRITKAAVYSSNFTPSTQPLAVLPNTVMLTFQDNRFRDSSALNATVTPAGTASIQAFSPFVPAYITPTTYSVGFPGSGSTHVAITSNVLFGFGTGAYTVEAWVYIRTGSTIQGIVFCAESGSGGWNGDLGSSGAVNISKYGSGGVVSGNSGDIATGAWYHIAWVRTSTGTNDTKIYVNGVLKTTGTDNNNWTNYGSPSIGSFTNLSACLTGLVSNMRIIKGQALTSGNFNPPAFPVNNTSVGWTGSNVASSITGSVALVACQSSTFVDNSGNSFTLTPSATTVTIQSSPTPFPAKVDTTTLNSAYSTSLIGGSGYYDGTGDYLVTPTSAALSSTLLASDFTIECWLYITTYPGGGAPIWTNSTSNSDGFSSAYVLANGTIGLGKVGVNEFVSTATVVRNAWNHIATVRSGATVYVYLNGVQVSSGAASTYLTTSTAKPLQIGQSNQSSPSALTGYLSGYRVVSSALYTSNFAPPLTPPTPVTNTQLLLNYTNGAIFDNTAKNVLETVGNAQISTTQSKYGGSSMYFDGTGDYLVSYNSVAMGTGDCTVEAWIYPIFTGAGVYGAFCTGPGGTTANLRFGVYTNQLYLDISGASVFASTGATISANTWTHIAVSRNSGTWRGFINGVQMGSTTTQGTASITGTERFVGVLGTTGGGNAWNGYIDDLRVTQGIGRYLTNFTPPTSQLQDQ
jgi:hypothetical protein